MDARWNRVWCGVAVILLLSPIAFALDEADLQAFASYRDEHTGALVFNLTPNPAHDDVIYQTHPTWTPGMEHFLFQSDRDGDGARPWILELRTGVAAPVAPGQALGMYALAPEGDQFFFMADRTLHSLDPRGAFGERQVSIHASLPKDAGGLAGGMSVGPGSGRVFVGLALAEDQWGIGVWESATDTWHVIGGIPFQVGHLQANPVNRDLLLFCHETGGDAPQRVWLLNLVQAAWAPFSPETYGEWVTHECWWGADRVIFTVWPYDDARKAQAHGVIWADLATGQRHLLAQYPAWHTQGSADRQWVLGDDFDRNLWLINPMTLERKLLTQGHRSGDLNTHPHASFTPDSTGIVFNSSRNGQQDIFLVLLP